MSDEIEYVRVKVDSESFILFGSIDDVLAFAATFWDYKGFRTAWGHCYPERLCKRDQFSYHKARGKSEIERIVNETRLEDGRLLADVLYNKLSGKVK